VRNRRQQRQQVQVEPVPPPPPPDHTLRNAAIIGGAVLAAGGGLALQQHRILGVGKQTLQRAAKRERAEGFRQGLKDATRAVKERLNPTKTPVDPVQSHLETMLWQNRFMMDLPRPHQPEYPKHVAAIMQRVHAPIEGENQILASHTPKEAAQQIFKIKRERIHSEIKGFKTQRQDRLDEGAAWDAFHKGELKRYHKEQGLPNVLDKTKLPGKFKDYGYSKEHKAIVNLKNPPEVDPTKKKRGFERLIKLIELDVTLKETRDPSGRFASGGGAMLPDPGSLQYAYHMPMVNPDGQGGGAPQKRGRGRPPGSLNRRTLAEAQMVQADAIAQQPESRQPSHVGRNIAIGAGILAGGALVAGPRIAKAFSEHTATSRSVKEVLPKILAGEHLDFAESAQKHGLTVEEAISHAHEAAIAAEKPVAEIVANADQFARENPGVAFKDNPHISPARAAQMAKQNKATVNTRATIRASQAEVQTEKARTALSKKELELQDLEFKIKQQTKEHAELTEKFGATSQVVTDAHAKIGDLQKQLAASAPPLTSQERVRAALGRLKEEAGEQNTDQEIAALRKHHRTYGHVMPTVQVRPGKQGELFDVFNVQRVGQPGTSVVPFQTAKERVDLLKEKILANRGEEINRIASAHYPPHSPEDIAEAMALRHAAAETVHIEPAIAPPRPGATSGELAKYESTYKSKEEQVLARDRQTQKLGEMHIRNKGVEAAKAYDEESKRTGSKHDTRERERRKQLAEENAARAWTQQALSEGRIPKRIVQGVRLPSATDPTLKGKKRDPKDMFKPVFPTARITAREIAQIEPWNLARRLLNRIELLHAPASIYLELRPHMIS
jgi:hypothetical protein